ncbi:MAG: DUF2625 family protein [Clostridium sp.]|nr:DUF2625 family protein [Clostridium sp.]
MNIWNETKCILKSSIKNVKILSPNTCNNTLNNLNIDENSILGQVIINTGGIFIENYIRLFGSGDEKNSYNIYKYNLELKKYFDNDMIIIGDDVFGGIFSLNKEKNTILYFAPDTLEWEDLEITYKDFIKYASSEKIDEFYKSYKWSTFQEDIKEIKFNEGILIYPFLWSNECNIEKAKKDIVPFSELLQINMEFREKFGIDD